MVKRIMEAFVKDYQTREQELVEYADLVCPDEEDASAVHDYAVALPAAVLNIIEDWATIHWDDSLLGFCTLVRQEVGLGNTTTE